MFVDLYACVYIYVDVRYILVWMHVLVHACSKKATGTSVLDRKNRNHCVLIRTPVSRCCSKASAETQDGMNFDGRSQSANMAAPAAVSMCLAQKVALEEEDQDRGFGKFAKKEHYPTASSYHNKDKHRK